MAGVLVTRARADAERTAHRLRALGHVPVIAPVIETVATGAVLPEGPFDAIVATSANAALGATQLARATPVLTVGERTAGVFRAMGFAMVDAADGDAGELAAMVAQRLPRGARLLYLAGRDRKPTLETALAATGHAMTAVAVYAADAAPDWPPAIRQALAEGKVGHALHFSRRSAELALRQVERAGLMQPFRALVHCCLSQDVAEALRPAGLDLVIAGEPGEDVLLALLPPSTDGLV
jgi:uroporphyrinogen-III synthase